MNKQDNPYFNFLESIKKSINISPSHLIGVVTNTNPLLINVNEVQLDRSDMLINTDITTFSIGDRVVFLFDEKQEEFILLCRVR